METDVHKWTENLEIDSSANWGKRDQWYPSAADLDWHSCIGKNSPAIILASHGQFCRARPSMHQVRFQGIDMHKSIAKKIL